MKLLSITLSLLLIHEIYSQEVDYNYSDKGPDAWFDIGFPLCNGQMQSPVNIIKEDLVYDCKLAPFVFVQTNELPFTLTRSESKVEFVQNSTEIIKLKGSNFQHNIFEFVNGHFHWGFNDYQGSEHTVDWKKFPLELHLVHRLPNRYNDKDSRFTVLGVLFELSNSDNPVLNGIIEALNVLNPLVVMDNKPSTIINLNLLQILPKNLHYYRYDGSLTTPPCLETVTWNVFKETVKISSNQLSAIRGNFSQINFRDPQPLNCRTVFSSFQAYSPFTCPNYKEEHHYLKLNPQTYNYENGYTY